MLAEIRFGFFRIPLEVVAHQPILLFESEILHRHKTRSWAGCGIAEHLASKTREIGLPAAAPPQSYAAIARPNSDSTPQGAALVSRSFAGSVLGRLSYEEPTDQTKTLTPQTEMIPESTTTWEEVCKQ